jgi:hypothetical protein
MTHQDILAIVAMFNLKDGYKVSYNFDQYGSTQFILEKDGALAYRYWSYETDVAYWIERAMEYAGTRKSPEEIAQQEAAARAHQLRNDALFFMDNGFDATALLSDFTREEIEAEIAVVKADLELIQSPVIVSAVDTKTKIDLAHAFLGKAAENIQILNGGTLEGLIPDAQGSMVMLNNAEGSAIFVKFVEDEQTLTATLDGLWMVIRGDVKTVTVKTHGGMTLKAPISHIVAYADGGMSGSWDMRHNLIRNQNYQYVVRPDDVKEVHYE